MNRRWLWPLVGWCVAVAATSTMDATGLSTFSALPLFPLFLLFWWLQRIPRKSVAMSWGDSGAWKWYVTAAVYPVALMGAIALIAAFAGALHAVAAPHHQHTLWVIVPISVLAGLPVVLLTEEGFFRGWLWASLERAGQTTVAVVGLTSVAFALWHWSSVLLPTGFNPPIAQVPIFMINAAVMGAIWGMLRQLSGSLLVSSLAHSVWNGLAYSLFGFGTTTGALGIANTALFGPEVGILGLLLNSSLLLFLATYLSRHLRKRSA